MTDSETLITLAQQAVSAAMKAGATAADALVVSATDVNAGMRNGAPETIERAESVGVGLRVFVGQGIATLSSSDLTSHSLNETAAHAVAIAKAAPPDPFAGLSDVYAEAHQRVFVDAQDATLPEMTHLQVLAREAEAAGLAVSGITKSNGGDASASHHHLALVTSHGFSGHHSTARYSLSVSLIAGQGEAMQRDYDYATVTHFADLPDAASIGAGAAARALAKLNPRKLPSQTAPVYFEPRVGRSLLSAFASAISGAAITRGTSFLKDALNSQVFSDTVSIIDDPLRSRGLGSRPFDVEGVAGQHRAFIDRGTLTSWVLDTRSANQLGLKTTGHASRGLSGAPHPSTTNLYIEKGNHSVAELFSTLGDGFYVTETIGHGMNLITGDYSVGAAGFWIENGVRAFAVSEVTIAGNLRDIFKTLIPANDIAFHYATNVPTLAVPEMTIAGNG